jgi:hypothetical protein
MRLLISSQGYIKMSIWLNIASVDHIDEHGPLADKLAALCVECSAAASEAEKGAQDMADDDADGRSELAQAEGFVALNFARSLALSGRQNLSAVRDALVDEQGGAVSGAFVQDPFLIQIATVSLSENAGLEALKERILALPEIPCSAPDLLRLREMVRATSAYAPLSCDLTFLLVVQSLPSLFLLRPQCPHVSCHAQNGLVQGRFLRETGSGKGGKVTLKKLKLRNNSGVAIDLLPTASETAPDTTLTLRVRVTYP